MSCEEHARLEQEHSQAKARYDDARRALDHKIGVSPRGEFLHLRRAIDEAGVALERAQSLFARHVKEHGCEPSRQGSSEAAAEA